MAQALVTGSGDPRAFALERLAARGATIPMLRRHAEVMLTLFERFYRDIVDGGASPGDLLKPAECRPRQSAGSNSLGKWTQWRCPHGDRTRRGLGSRSRLPDERGTPMGRLAMVQGAAAENRRLHPKGGRRAVLARLRRARLDSVA